MDDAILRALRERGKTLTKQELAKALEIEKNENDLFERALKVLLSSEKVVVKTEEEQFPEFGASVVSEKYGLAV